MKPVMQAHTVAEHGWGDCFSACLAAVLEIPLEEVPQFSRLGDEDAYGSGKKFLCWQWHLDAWLAERGLMYITVRKHGQGWRSEWDIPGLRGQYCIVGGPSSRTKRGHAVVGRMKDEWGTLDFVHDPHPSGEFLAGEPEEFTFILARPAEVTP